MKKILNILSVAVLALMAASCNRSVEFEHESFATFNTINYSVAENGKTLTIPVSIYNPKGSETQIAVKVVEGAAENGTDFEIVTPANGILTFGAGVDSLAIVMSISDAFVGEFTGAKDFQLVLSSLTEGVSVGNFNTATVTINDTDHPLSEFFGTWSGKTFEEAYMEADVTLEFNITADSKDISKVVMSIVDPMMATVVGYKTPVVLTADAKYNPEDGTGTIVVPNGQATGFEYSYGAWVYMGFNAADFGSASGYENLVMKLNADGKITVANGFGIFDDMYIWASYVGGYTLTKK